MENDLENEDWFELARGSSQRGSELSRVDCTLGVLVASNSPMEGQDTSITGAPDENFFKSKYLICSYTRHH